MEYTVDKLAELSGVSARTLRYYDQIGLLRPRRAENGYRVYGTAQVDLLQQILFYRELGMPLSDVKALLFSADYDRKAALESHLEALKREKLRVERLIGTVAKTIETMKGETDMTDEEKFEGLKEKLARENETAYGDELRERFGDEAAESFGKKFKSMSREQWNESERLSGEIKTALKKAAETGDPSSETARELCGLHRRWLCLFWPEGTYSARAHMALAESYVADERFKRYYDAVTPDGARFLRDALRYWCEK